MSKARGIADSTATLDVDGGTIKLDGNYPVGTNNVALGDTALDAVDSGAIANTAVGHGAATALTSGDENTAIGNAALATATTAINNTAVGSLSLQDTTSGSYNVAVGKDALQSNTTASENTAVGYQAAYANTTGAPTTALGYQAAYANSTAGWITALGYQALKNSTAGPNTAVGRALVTNTTGIENTAVGMNANYYNTTGSYNVALGSSALFLNTTASLNTAVGYQAGYSNTTGDNNTFMGERSGYLNTTGDRSSYYGSLAGNATTGRANTFIGADAGYLVTTGVGNTILGRYSGNAGDLDIRTSSNNIVLSDGDGRLHQYSRVYHNLMSNGVGHHQNVLYAGPATGWNSTSSPNTWTTITAIDFNDGALRAGNGVIVKVLLYTTNLNPTYGYYTMSLTQLNNSVSNTSYVGTTTATSDGTGGNGYELPVTTQCHTSTSYLNVRLRIENVGGSKCLQVYSNATPASNTSAPSLIISATAHNHY